MTSLPTTMRAVRLSAPGPVDNLRLTTLPLPPERDGWVRIRVEAFGLNRSELKLRLGLGVGVSFPRVPGIEAAGTVDVVVDLVGGETRLRSLDVLREGGLLLPVPRGLDVSQEAARRGIRLLPMIVEPDYRGLEELAAMVRGQALSIRVETALPLELAAQAHEAMESGHATGKTVLLTAAEP